MMMRYRRNLIAILSASMIISLLIIPATANGTTWDETFGGAGNDQATAVVACSDGGYAIGGNMEDVASGYWRMGLIKLDDQMEVVWEETYGSDIATDICEDMIEVSTGGFLLVGRDYNHDMLVVRTDTTGGLTWNKSYYGLPGGGHAQSVFECADGSFILSGYAQGEAALLKIDSNGNHLWNKTCSNLNDALFNANLYSVIENDAGELIAVGYIENMSTDYDSDLWIFHTDSDGNKLQNMTIDFHNSGLGYEILEVSTGGYVIAGITSDEYNPSIGLLVYMEDDFDVPWYKTFDEGEYSDQNILYDLVECADGGFALTGRTDHHDYQANVWIVRTDNEGNLEWSKTHGGTQIELGKALAITPSGDFIVVGITQDTPQLDENWIAVVFTDAPELLEQDPTLIIIGIGIAIIVIVLVIFLLKRR